MPRQHSGKGQCKASDGGTYDEVGQEAAHKEVAALVVLYEGRKLFQVIADVGVSHEPDAPIGVCRQLLDGFLLAGDSLGLGKEV